MSDSDAGTEDLTIPVSLVQQQQQELSRMCGNPSVATNNTHMHHRRGPSIFSLPFLPISFPTLYSQSRARGSSRML